MLRNIHVYTHINIYIYILYKISVFDKVRYNFMGWGKRRCKGIENTPKKKKKVLCSNKVLHIRESCRPNFK